MKAACQLRVGGLVGTCGEIQAVGELGHVLGKVTGLALEDIRELCAGRSAGESGQADGRLRQRGRRGATVQFTSGGPQSEADAAQCRGIDVECSRHAATPMDPGSAAG